MEWRGCSYSSFVSRKWGGVEVSGAGADYQNETTFIQDIRPRLDGLSVFSLLRQLNCPFNR